MKEVRKWDPLITDREYDQLFDELTELEKERFGIEQRRIQKSDSHKADAFAV